MNKKILTAAAILAAVSMANAAKAKLDDGVFET